MDATFLEENRGYDHYQTYTFLLAWTTFIKLIVEIVADIARERMKLDAPVKAVTE